MVLPALTEALVRSALSAPHRLPFAGGGGKGERNAATLLTVTPGPAPEVLAILRASRLTDHGGEVGFPGGKPEPGDENLLATAVRETEEEVGIAPDDLAHVGALAPMTVITRKYLIHPFVAVRQRTQPLQLCQDEVADVYGLPLWDYLRGDAEIVAVPTATGFFPHFPLPDGRILYGASAVTFYELLSRLASALERPLPPPRMTDEVPWAKRYER